MIILNDHIASKAFFRKKRKNADLVRPLRPQEDEAPGFLHSYHFAFVENMAIIYINGFFKRLKKQQLLFIRGF